MKRFSQKKYNLARMIYATTGESRYKDLDSLDKISVIYGYLVNA